MSNISDGNLRFSDFAFDIPKELFRNSEHRGADEAKLVVVDAASETIVHDRFRNLGDFLADDDAIVLNDAGISRSRLCGFAESGQPLDVCFVLQEDSHLWEAMVLSDDGFPPAEGRFTLAGGIDGEVLGPVSAFGPDRIAEFDAQYWIERDRYHGYRALIRCAATKDQLRQSLDVHGAFMYPWYTNHEHLAEDELNPITTRRLGAVLVSEPARRLTPEMLVEMAGRGIDTISVSLWMSFGWNFWDSDYGDMPLSDNKMNFEEYAVTDRAAGQIRDVVGTGRRLIGIGTSSVRVLESLPVPAAACDSRTNLFLSPGTKLKYCSGLLTNLHNSMATHIVMAATFAPADLIREAYRQSIEYRYGFGIHGDSMLVIGDHTPTSAS
ncbi:S-adenosylmethionine:tRNA ribosyltransferase-isomerase [Streptomyces sp. SID13031]|uniref:S-adenosylmethionine:tRNA ribosyltransferase-isomerase n=1 Tax=Streptomyces sp. SID13031 TaxID=2706046 RepID=UPI0013CCBCB7|nr:S-adenosylmethionine:tRNA ribosyltransferase-isomerase [Streptomyces sp. SID13031]NEA36912.1 S-adenosylmethionine:tRNA ribosyltransferase-isomerase [Streptomyces sp. SID13031]